MFVPFFQEQTTVVAPGLVLDNLESPAHNTCLLSYGNKASVCAGRLHPEQEVVDLHPIVRGYAEQQMGPTLIAPSHRSNVI